MAERVEAWALGTFHVLVLALVTVLPTHATGALANALAGLGTLLGFALFGYLWLLTGVATGWALDGESFGTRQGSDLESLFGRAMGGGALAALAFTISLLVPVTVDLVVHTTANPGALLLVVVIGAGIATAVGVVVGCLLTLLDVGLYRLASGLVPDETG